MEGFVSEQMRRREGSMKVDINLGSKGEIITINVPLFKKLRDIIFFLRDTHFLSCFKGHFEGAKTFLTP